MAVGTRSTTVSPQIALSAVEYALTLVGGWKDEDRGEITVALNDFKSAAEHNAKMHKQASDAVKELSVRGKVVEDGEASLKTRTEDFDAKAEVTLAELQGRDEAVKVDEAAVARDKITFNMSASEDNRALAVREDDVSAREKTSDAVRKSLEDREAAVLAKESQQRVDTHAIHAGLNAIAAASDELQGLIQ